MIVMAAVAVAAISVISCDRYDHGRPDKDIRSEFSRMYPDAFDVDWDWEGTHWQVSFETGSVLMALNMKHGMIRPVIG